uniref:Multidrug resistance-associated protein 5 n=1 Tax=Biomphalaria glabrata TaxID=6526 RepID=A0A2C9JFB3_BIOGL
MDSVSNTVHTADPRVDGQGHAHIHIDVGQGDERKLDDVDKRSESQVTDTVRDSSLTVSGKESEDFDCEFGPKVQRRPGLGRYKHGLKYALPFRLKKSDPSQLPLETNGLLNYMTFGWLNRYMWLIYRHGVSSVKDLRINQSESSQVGAQRMARFWQKELADKGQDKASFGHAIFRSFKTRILIGTFASLIYAVFTLANPIFVINYFLVYLTESDVSVKSGIIYAIACGLFLLLKGLTGAFFWMLNYEAATRIKYGTLALLYRKILHLKSLKDKSVGDMVNFISNDGQRLWDGIILGPFIISSLIIVIMSCVYSVMLMGPWSLISFIIIIGFYPFAMFCAKMSQCYRERSIKITDKRVSFMNTLLTSIRLIKMYAWEMSFAKKISEIRSEEQRLLEKSVFIQSISMGSSMLVPLFASSLMFIAYVTTGHNLTAAQAFTFIALLNTMQTSMSTLPFALKAISEMVISTRRIQEVLLMEEVSLPPLPTSSATAIQLVNACLSWPPSTAHKNRNYMTNCCLYCLYLSRYCKKKAKENGEKNIILSESKSLNEHEKQNGHKYSEPLLKNINLDIKKGQLVGICGKIGSGKTSLINAILGRLSLESGMLLTSGHCAYVPQQAWITNNTVRENIVFGQQFDPERYNKVLQACALTEDLKSFPIGDITEVGERGTTLSGGQKQRISLARAAYSDYDILLLDDPLSAVDVHVGNHIFNQCILGLMKGRTVLFVTHCLEFLQHCDQILVMRNGVLVEEGSHSQMLANGREYANVLSFYSSEDYVYVKEGLLETRDFGKNINGRIADSNSNNLTNHCVQQVNNHTETMGKSHATTEDQSTKLMKEEELDKGYLQFSVVHQYIQSMGGYLILALVLFCFCLPVAGVTSANWFLSYWIQQSATNTSFLLNKTSHLNSITIEDLETDKYLLIYAGFIPVLIVLILLRSFCIMKASLRAATHLHDSGFKSVLKCSMSFFESTPLGRIINRFSADLDEIDIRLPLNVEIFLSNVLQVLAALAIIGYVSPWFLLSVVPLGFLFFILMKIFHICVCELKCLDNVTRSPVISHMAVSVQGLACIHAFRMTNVFVEKHCQLLNINSVAVLLFYSSNRWLALRLDLVSAGVAFMTGLLVLLGYDHLNPSLAGLALSFALQLSGLFQYTARLTVETEARFNSVHRILKDINDTKNIEQTKESDQQNISNWPRAGSVNFNNIKLRYHNNPTLALKGVTFQVEANEKIGIVGKTGAGKSSLAAALFRLVELESGQIFIDDVDISKIPLNDLRSRLSIIPQDPVLFTGTIRSNLDPFQKYSDDEIWQVLNKYYMASLIKTLDHQLDTPVSENGDNFSAGEKQLICMARVLLRKSKILVLDEATASIDSETDTLIKKTLQEACKNCTMLIIAHRLKTVLECDKILVLEEGMVQEFDSPSNLLSNANSKFRAMFEASGSALSVSC